VTSFDRHAGSYASNVIDVKKTCSEIVFVIGSGQDVFGAYSCGSQTPGWFIDLAVNEISQIRRAPMRAAKDFHLFDLHHHIGTLHGVSGSVSGPSAGTWTIEKDAERRVAFMDTYDIEQALLMPTTGYAAPDGIAATCRVNDEVARYRDRRRDRFPVAVGTVSPLDGERGVDEIDRCIRDLGMQGIVWHHRYQGASINHPIMDAFLERVRFHKVPAFVHIIATSTLESPWRLEVLAEKYRDITFVGLDGFSSGNQSQWMPYLAARHPNILFDTGVLTSNANLIENFVHKVGAERLLLGTDFYSSPKVFNCPYPILELLASELEDAQLLQILGGNARRLFGL
jgi:predicted TIM-barrel fold metal-dependent hydrolase